MAACFVDRRHPEHVEYGPQTLVGRRIAGIALGYEDVNDHDALRHDPALALLGARLQARRAEGGIAARRNRACK